MKNELTQEELKRLLNYDPDTGIFTWNEPVIVKHSIRYYRYVIIQIGNRYYQAHRLAFLYMTGENPQDGLLIDHINHRADDNRWKNLRLATPLQNSANRSTTSSTGYKGVYARKDHFIAVMTINGERVVLGKKPTSYEASLLYNEAAAKRFGEFAFTGSAIHIYGNSSS